jgi:hypothetical protein
VAARSTSGSSAPTRSSGSRCERCSTTTSTDALTNTETGEKRLEKGVLESTGLRDDGIFAEGGRRAAARADLRRGRGSGASLRVREAARLAHDARAALVTPERIPSADEIAWGVETRSSCRDAFVFVYEASEKVAAVDL